MVVRSRFSRVGVRPHRTPGMDDVSKCALCFVLCLLFFPRGTACCCSSAVAPQRDTTANHGGASDGDGRGFVLVIDHV